MTDPEWVSSFDKCAGIVTDEGGFLCHAAIVCREMGLPCVVGTKIATRVLKDGDIISIDGNKGTVLKKIVNLKGN